MTPSADFIPFALPDVGDLEADAVAAAVRSGWITSGPVMRAFESDFSEFIGGSASDAGSDGGKGILSVATNSATAGLHLALEAIGLGRGDEVIVPTWTFTSTAEVVRYLGATPVIVDVDPDTLNISTDAIAAAVSPRTKAVIPVHMAGLPVDLAAVRAALGNPEIRIIEDAAHSLPAIGPQGLVGTTSHSDAAVFSFYATKTITTGEGGMVTTTDPDIAARLRVMRLHGIDRDAFDRYTSNKPSWAYDVVAPGFKYNMSDIAAAMGRVQLARACALQQRRQEIAEHYLSELEGLPITLPTQAPQGQLHSWHLFVCRVGDDAAVGRNEFIAAMAEQGVGTSVHFIPLHEHTYWKAFVPDAQARLPVACEMGPRAFSLPIYTKMTDAQVERVVAAVRQVLA